MYEHILVPTDGSKLSEKATRAAVALAAALGARLTVMTVVEPWGTDGRHIDLEEAHEVYEERARPAAEERLRPAVRAAEKAGVPVDTEIRFEEHPWEAIIAVADARHCDLIQMASHGRRGVEALVLGSETVRVLTHSKIPVLVHR